MKVIEESGRSLLGKKLSAASRTWSGPKSLSEGARFGTGLRKVRQDRQMQCEVCFSQIYRSRFDDAISEVSCFKE